MNTDVKNSRQNFIKSNLTIYKNIYWVLFIPRIQDWFNIQKLITVTHQINLKKKN